MAALTTVGGWFVVVAACYFLYYTTQAKNRKAPALKGGSKQVESRAPKAKKAKKDGALSSGDQDVKSSTKSKKKAPAPKAAQEVESIPRAQTTKDTDRDDEIDNREFARQLASLKTGTVMAPKSQTSTKTKSVKQSRAQEKEKEKVPVETSSDNATAPSSATGGDADDDQSSLNSPDLSATAVASPVINGDVSDMLERPASGPSVLKITESNNPSRPKKTKQPAAFEAVETKKQRQNRKKNEIKKTNREEEEKDRQVALEQQRRTARLAEGRAAKDGSTFKASKAPAESAWIGAPATNGAKTNHGLLDTYESGNKATSAVPPVQKKVTTVPAEALYSEGEQAGSDWQNNFSALPSEEEQTRKAIEASGNWETVKTKEKRKKAAPKEEKHSSSDEQNNYSAPPVITPTGPEKKWTADPVHAEPNSEVVEREMDLQDSEWEVA